MSKHNPFMHLTNPQEFIDREWIMHVHRTEHVLADTWRVPSQRKYIRDMVTYTINRVECQFCLEKGFNIDYSEDEEKG